MSNRSIASVLFILFTSIYCNQKAPNTITKNGPISSNNIDVEDSTSILRRKLKLIYPSYDLQFDSVVSDRQKYSRDILVDTFGCSSFINERDFLGKLTNIVAVKIKYGNGIYLKSGELKLWVYNINTIKERISDTVLISPLIYGIRGDEKVVGFPTILTKVTIPIP